MYTLEGVVYGECWDGSKGCYDARTLMFKNREDMESYIKKIEENKNFDGLDAGMGFKNVIAVVYTVIEKIEIEKDEKVYQATRVEDDWIFLSKEKLKESEYEFIDECMIHLGVL